MKKGFKDLSEALNEIKSSFAGQRPRGATIARKEDFRGF